MTSFHEFFVLVSLSFFSIFEESTSLAQIHFFHESNCQLSVETQNGTILGKVDPNYPSVEQYLGIPFATPPLENLRFSPPRPFEPHTSFINATREPPACMQLEQPTSVFDELLPGYDVVGTSSEDCLKLSIWTPARTSRGDLLPVLVFFYGGGYTHGGINTPYQIPTGWIEREKNLILVKPQYRLNFFGFPNSAALADQNVGLLDQRLAIEWLRDNIQAFGGDPSRITIWGQSAGSISVDYYSFAYSDDPIVSGLIMTSGTALLPTTQSQDFLHTNFSSVANNVGCAGLDAEQELSCVRGVPAQTIAQFVQNFNGTSKLKFAPIADEKLVFKNYTARALKGLVAEVPAIIGTNRNEGERFAKKGVSEAAPNQLIAELATVIGFLCPAVKTSENRRAIGRQIFRYEYAGNFSNISPLPWMGAYHASILPLLFGTYENISGRPSTAYESAVSNRLQQMWRAFAANPDSLPGLGWPLWNPITNGNSTDTVQLFAGPGDHPSSAEKDAVNEDVCGIFDRIAERIDFGDF